MYLLFKVIRLCGHISQKLLYEIYMFFVKHLNLWEHVIFNTYQTNVFIQVSANRQ